MIKLIFFNKKLLAALFTSFEIIINIFFFLNFTRDTSYESLKILFVILGSYNGNLVEETYRASEGNGINGKGEFVFVSKEPVKKIWGW